MGLCIIAGGSGAGKTEYIYRKLIELSVKEPEGRFFVVTPEQATMQAQKEIVRLHPNHGTLNIDIVSFERLAYRSSPCRSRRCWTIRAKIWSSESLPGKRWTSSPCFPPT